MSKLPSNAVGVVPRHETGNYHNSIYNSIIPDNSAFNDLQNSGGKVGNVNSQDVYKYYYKASGNNLKSNGTFSGFIYSYLLPLNSDGKVVNDPIQGHTTNYKAEKLNDNLSLQQIDAQSFTGIAYSKQSDGTVLFVFHIPKKDILIDNYDIGALKNSETIVFDSKSEDTANAKTAEFYGYNNNSSKLDKLPFALETVITIPYKDPNNTNSEVIYQALNANGNVMKTTTAKPIPINSQVSTQAGVTVHYINADNGQELSITKLPPADPSTTQSNVKLQTFTNYQLTLTSNIKRSGNVITLNNGNTITLGDNDSVASITNSDAKTISVTYPNKQNELSNVYVFYQGIAEQGEVQFLDADTKDAKGPNGYKLLETKKTNQGHYGEQFTFPDGQDPETILNHYTNTAHYVYDASKQGKNAYSFNKTYTYTDNANNNQGNIYYIYLHHATTPLNHTVTRTIRYIKSDGSKMDGVSDQVQKVSFTGTHDLVTDKDNWDTNTNNTFSAVTSPTIKGYTVSQATVPEVTGITMTTPDDIETVVYTPVVNIKSLTVDYIDDVTGNTLQADHFSGNEGESSGYDTKNTIANYKNQGYQLVYPTQPMVRC